MRETKTIELIFNDEIERDNQTFFFKLTWKKYFKDWKKILIFTLVLVFLGFYPIKNFDTNLIYYLFKFGAIYLLIYWIIIWRSYIKAKRAFQIKLDVMVTELKTADQNSFSIIIDDNSIEIKNPFNNFCSVWDKTNFQFFENRILISFLNTTLNFVLHESEFRNTDFEIFHDLLLKKSSEQF